MDQAGTGIMGPAEKTSIALLSMPFVTMDPCEAFLLQGILYLEVV